MRLGRTGITDAGAPVLRATENDTDNPFVQDRRKVNKFSGRSRPVSAATSTLLTRIPTMHSDFHPIIHVHTKTHNTAVCLRMQTAHASAEAGDIGKMHVRQKAAWRPGGKGGVLSAACGWLSSMACAWSFSLFFEIGPLAASLVYIGELLQLSPKLPFTSFGVSDKVCPASKIWKM